MRVSIITSLYNCEKYLDGFFEAADKIKNKEAYEFLLIHNDPKEKELQKINIETKEKPWFKHIIVEEREGLYESWNRAIRIAQSEYCAIWNVDDIRTPESIFLQMNALENNYQSDLSFGDIWGTAHYGTFKEKLYIHPTWEENKRAYMYRHMIGCFPLWRKTVHNKIGYFDEQLKLVADLDFQVRIARISKIIKVKQEIGYYLVNSPHKLSSNGRLQAIERNVINLRYANFDLIDFVYIYSAIKNFKIFEIKNGDNTIQIKKMFPAYRLYWLIRLPLLIVPFIKFPRDLLRFIYHKFIQR